MKHFQVLLTAVISCPLMVIAGCTGTSRNGNKGTGSADTINGVVNYSTLNKYDSEDQEMIGNGTIKTDSDSLVIYYPQYKHIDFVCGTMPSEKDSNVIFCAEAAFTGELLKYFKHSNIAGDHVSSGIRYKGYRCKRNTGAFVFYNGKYKFLYNQYSQELDSAAKYGGMGFGQEMIIHKGESVPCIRKSGNKNEFRALCELDHKLCIIDSKGVIRFKDFKNALLHLGVTEALYLDMGGGWNYSWRRDKTGTVHVIHPKSHNYTTNWITFYK